MPVILIIDDEDEFREMLRQVLERSGYKVVEASDGNEGLRLVSARTKSRFFGQLREKLHHFCAVIQRTRQLIFVNHRLLR